MPDKKRLDTITARQLQRRYYPLQPEEVYNLFGEACATIDEGATEVISALSDRADHQDDTLAKMETACALMSEQLCAIARRLKHIDEGMYAWLVEAGKKPYLSDVPPWNPPHACAESGAMGLHSDAKAHSVEQDALRMET